MYVILLQHVRFEQKMKKARHAIARYKKKHKDPPLSPFEHRIRPISGPIRKCNIFSVFAVYVIHKFNTYLGTFVRKWVIKLKPDSLRYE